MPFVGEAAALATAVLWTLGSFISSALGRRIGALRLNTIRLPLATLMLLASCVLAGGWSRLSPEAVAWLAASGIVGLALGDSFLYSCYTLVGARLGVLLFSLAPAMTAVLGYLFLGETLGPRAMGGVALVTLGVCVVTLERLPSGGGTLARVPLKGVVHGLLAALAQAAGLILAKQGMSLDTSPLFATLVRMVTATAVFYVVMALGRRLENPLAILRSGPRVFRMAVLWVFMGPFVGVWLSLVAVQHTATGVAATLIALEPVMMIPLVVLLEGYRPSARAVVGALVAFGGTALLFLRQG
ncbi:DMT family transporter [Desulfocurvus sp. DL9XJH121]